jgi:hypothetical protein
MTQKTTIFSDIVGGRQVILEQDQDGEYSVQTTEAEDNPSGLIGSGMTFSVPKSAGDPAAWSSGSIAEIYQDLLRLKFTEDEAKKITNWSPTP